MSGLQHGGGSHAQKVVSIVFSGVVERLPCKVATWCEGAEHDHELVPDVRVAFGGEGVDHRWDEIVKAEVARATALTREAVDGVTANVGHRISERRGEHVGRGVVGDVIEHGETTCSTERIWIGQRCGLQRAHRSVESVAVRAGAAMPALSHRSVVDQLVVVDQLAIGARMTQR